MDQHSSLFSLTIDPVTKTHLQETAKWARFFAIIGFIFCALLALGGIFGGTLMNMAAASSDDLGAQQVAAAGGIAMGVAFIIMAVIYFFPCLYLFRFSSRMRRALAGNNQEELNDSFSNLRATFRYIGILTIIALSLYILMFVLMFLGYAAM